MARRRNATTTRKAGDVVVVQTPAPPVRRGGGGGRRRSAAKKRRYSKAVSVGGQAGSYKNRLIGTGVGGLAYGFIEKQFPNLPTIPLIGKSGTVALAAYFFGGSHPIIKDIGIAAAAIAGYSLGKDGIISGDYDGVHGIAAQT